MTENAAILLGMDKSELCMVSSKTDSSASNPENMNYQAVVIARADLPVIPEKPLNALIRGPDAKSHRSATMALRQDVERKMAMRGELHGLPPWISSSKWLAEPLRGVASDDVLPLSKNVPRGEAL